MFTGNKISLTEGLTFIVCLAVLAVLIIIEFNLPCLTNKYSLTLSIIAGIFSGIISAITLLYFQEQHQIRQVNKYYAEIAGKYTRIDIGQDNALDDENNSMKEQNVGLQISLTHINGTHSFKLKANYWKNADALVEGTIEFNEKNGTTAYGRYRYTKSKDKLFKHMGTYKIYRLEDDKSKLLVQFHHVFPRENENNPDANRGWEIWQKI